MKRIISLVLSAVMVASMCVGLNFNALAKNVSALSFKSKDGIVLYEGNDCYQDREENGQGVWEQYTVYNIDNRSVFVEGNELTVSYDDGTSEKFTVQEIYVQEEGYYTNAFKSESGNIIRQADIGIDRNQSLENQWTVGNNYTFYVEYKGQKAEATVELRENPVKNIKVNYDGALTLFENCVGETDTDYNENEYFRYWNGQINYLRLWEPTITVTYSDNSEKTFSFVKDNWLPVNKDDESELIEGNYFDLQFDQEQNHFTVGGENKGYISYYGRKAEIPVNVVEKHDVNEGEIDAQDYKGLLFYSDEWHTIKFTPDESGIYTVSESIAYQLKRSDDFEYSFTDGENALVDLSEDWEDDFKFLLEKGKTYTFKMRRKDGSSDNSAQFEFFGISNPEVAISDFKFIPAEAINVYAGDYLNDSILFKDGNVVELTLTNGDKTRFVCEDGDYSDEDNNDLWSYFDSKGIEYNAELSCEASAEPWVKGEDAFITVKLANASDKVNVTVIDPDIAAIKYEPAKPLEVVEGTAEKREHYNADDDREEYDYYPLNAVDLETYGNKITVTYNDNTTETFTYKFVSRQDGAEYNHEAYISDSGKEINTRDLSLTYTQDYQHQWTVGNSYPVTVVYHGRSSDVNVKVSPCPVKSISVTLDNPITLFKNCAGEERYDEATDSDFFSYYCDENYLRAQNAKFKVTYSDNSTKTFSYGENSWNPVDENGDELENRYFYFEFDQYGTKEKNLTPVATVRYYEKETTVPVQVVDKHDVNEGALELLKSKRVFFISDEIHTFTFTPAKSGGYIFAESLAWGVSDGDFSFKIEDQNKTAPTRVSESELAYNLEGGKTYTITTKHLDDNYTSMQTLGVYPYVYVTDFEFTPVNPLSATEGERFDDRKFVYVDGTKIKITLSNGDVSTFTATDNGNRFLNDDGVEIEDYLNDENVDGGLSIEPSHDIWRTDEDAYISITIGKKEKKLPVEVLESKVASIQFTPSKPVEIVSDLIWYYEWDDAYVSEIVDMISKPGDVLTVNYSDERGTVNYVQSSDGEVFVNENDPTDKIRVEYFYDSNKKYNVGDTINFMMSFQTASTTFTGTVVENPVLSAVYTPAEPYVFNENQDGRIWKRTRHDEQKDEDVDDSFFCYKDKSPWAEGSKFEVTYRENNETVTYTSDGKDFVSEGGAKLENAYINALWGRDQYENPFLPDKDNVVYVHYMNYETPVNVKINHVPDEAVVENSTVATCAKGGTYDLVVYCKECNKELSRENKTLPKTSDHTIVKDAAVPATFTSTGKTAGKHCSVCNTVFVAQKVTPKLQTPTLKLKKAKKSFTATWVKDNNVDGYQIQYGLKKNFKKAKTKWVNAGKFTAKKLKKKKTYYVRVRAYKIINGKTVYSNWSTKKVKTK